jgi:uncharacterized lipoprotein
MRLRFSYFFSCALLAACTSDGSRYRDTSALEKPPTLVVEKQEAAADAEGPEKAEAEKLPEDAASTSSKDKEDAASTSSEDQEVAEPKAKKGLGDGVVSISGARPLALTIKQPFDVAWNSLKRALIQSGIEVTDLEHDKGKFYVSYDADSYTSEHGSFIEKSVGLFSDDYAKQGYMLALTAEGSATKVTAVPVKDAEYRKRTDHDDEEAVAADVSDAADVDKPTDGVDKLLRSLYLTLKDDLREN